MNLNWRDGVATILAALAVMVLLAATLGWGWPIVGDLRGAGIVLWVLGVAMCPVAWVAVGAALGDHGSRVSLQQRLGLGAGYYGLMSGLGLVATLLLVWDLLAPGLLPMVALALVVIAMWAITTARHANPARPRRRLTA